MNPNKVAFTQNQNFAIEFIIKHHQTQRRVGTVLPYVVHPIEVASFAGRFYPQNQDLIEAAYLHDVLEDTNVPEADIEFIFGKTILGLIKGVTAKDGDFGSWRERRQHQIDKLEDSPLNVVRLKACDMLSNALAIGFDYQYRPEESYPKFRKSPNDVIWYYHSMLEKMEEVVPEEEFNVLDALRDAINVWS